MTRDMFEYAVLRVIPQIARGESINAGVILYCQQQQFLQCRVSLDRARLRALDPAADAEGIEQALAAVIAVCAAGPGSGPAGLEGIGNRFRWLTAARSTVVQAGPVHTGMTLDPPADLDRLLRVLVL